MIVNKGYGVNHIYFILLDGHWPPISHNDMSQRPFSILTFDPIFTLIVNCVDPCPMSSVLFKEVWKGGQVHLVFCFLIWLMIAFCQNLSQLILKLVFDLMLQQIKNIGLNVIKLCHVLYWQSMYLNIHHLSTIKNIKKCK